MRSVLRYTCWEEVADMSLDETIASAVVQAVLKEIHPLLERSENHILSEAAVLEMLGISAQTLRRMRADGLVAYRPYGSKYYYFEKDLEAYMKRNGRAV